MGQPLSMDLRSRVLAAVDKGMSCRAAAARFGVAPSTAIRWEAQRRETGGFAPKPQGGDMRSRRVEERRADILSVWEARKDITLDELRATLIETGLTVSRTALHRFFARHGITRKKDRPRDRARPPRRPETAPRLVRWPARPRSRTARVHPLTAFAAQLPVGQWTKPGRQPTT
jgi:transposase